MRLNRYFVPAGTCGEGSTVKQPLSMAWDFMRCPRNPAQLPGMHGKNNRGTGFKGGICVAGDQGMQSVSFCGRGHCGSDSASGVSMLYVSCILYN